MGIEEGSGKVLYSSIQGHSWCKATNEGGDSEVCSTEWSTREDLYINCRFTHGVRVLFCSLYRRGSN